MASSATFSAGPTVPSSSRTVVVHPLRASNLCSRFTNPSLTHLLISLQAQLAPSIAKTKESVGFVDETCETRECDEEDTDDEGEEDWEAELLGELNPLLYLHPRSQRNTKQRKEILNGATPSSAKSEAGAPDWVERARQRALHALEARNPSAADSLRKKIDPISNGKKQSKKKKKKKPQESSGLHNAQRKISVKKLEKALRLQDTNEANALREKEDVDFDTVSVDDFDLDDIDNIDDLPMGSNIEFSRWDTGKSPSPSPLSIALEHAKNAEQGLERERSFNKRLVGAKSALEVLEIVGNAEKRTRLLGFPSLLTPLNAATALHRIAKHMETSGTHKSERLAFARKKYMAELVASSMEVIAGCSTQGLSNIAWALSKIGGNILYFSEMDLIANVVLLKVSDFNCQNVANTLGAYSSMQHAAPRMFASLCNHAVDILEEFSSQELAQVLWAHAELSQPADPLLDALDSICLLSEKGLLNSFIDSDSTASTFDYPLSSMSSSSNFNPFGNASADHLANLAWSFAVLNQINRSSFKYLWQMLESILEQSINSMGDGPGGLSTWHLSQIHQVNLCLQYGYPHYVSTLKVLLKDTAAQAWESQKAKIWSPSEYQKDVKWLLVSMAQDWVVEYTAADYSLDLALPEEKTAIEIDGPTHFIRNTGSPLGHTILKRRLLSQAGWRVLSISYEVWEELDGETEQMSFLKELLRTGV